MTDVSAAPPTPVEYPSYLKDSDELPQPVRDIPLWSENYLTQAFDPATGVGFFFHLSRMPFNYDIWEGLFTCFLPGDRFLVARDFSWDTNDKGPGSNALRFEVVTPWQRWSKRFRGAALLVTGDQLRAGPIADDSHVFVDADLTFDNIGPVFDIGDMGEQFWARAHYEQHGQFTGHVSFDGTHLGLGAERYDFTGTGLRDHSLGARDILKMNNHVWTHGEFPSGRLFMVMDVHTKVGPPFTYVVVGDQNGFTKVELTRPTSRIDDASQVFDPHELHFVGPNGPSVIKAQILQAIPYSFTGPNEWSLGTHPNAHHLVIEAQTRFEWDGEVGYGLTERSVAF